MKPCSPQSREASALAPPRGPCRATSSSPLSSASPSRHLFRFLGDNLLFGQPQLQAGPSDVGAFTVVQVDPLAVAVKLNGPKRIRRRSFADPFAERKPSMHVVIEQNVVAREHIPQLPGDLLRLVSRHHGTSFAFRSAS